MGSAGIWAHREPGPAWTRRWEQIRNKPGRGIPSAENSQSHPTAGILENSEFQAEFMAISHKECLRRTGSREQHGKEGIPAPGSAGAVIFHLCVKPFIPREGEFIARITRDGAAHGNPTSSQALESRGTMGSPELIHRDHPVPRTDIPPIPACA